MLTYLIKCQRNKCRWNIVLVWSRMILFICADVKQCGWFSKDVLPWTTTLLTSVLSLFLTVIYVIKFCSWGKFKGIFICTLHYLSWNTNKDCLLQFKEANLLHFYFFNWIFYSRFTGYRSNVLKSIFSAKFPL